MVVNLTYKVIPLNQKYLECFFYKKMIGPNFTSGFKWLSLQHLSIVILKNVVLNKVCEFLVDFRSMNVATEIRFRGLDMSAMAGF